MRPVRPVVDDCVSFELALQPPVRSQVLVVRRHPVVVLESGIHVGAAGRLRHQDHVAELELRQDNLAVAVTLDRHELARRRAE